MFCIFNRGRRCFVAVHRFSRHDLGPGYASPGQHVDADSTTYQSAVNACATFASRNYKRNKSSDRNGKRQTAPFSNHHSTGSPDPTECRHNSILFTKLYTTGSPDPTECCHKAKCHTVFYSANGRERTCQTNHHSNYNKTFGTNERRHFSERIHRAMCALVADSGTWQRYRKTDYGAAFHEIGRLCDAGLSRYQPLLLISPSSRNCLNQRVVSPRLYRGNSSF